MNNKSDKPTIVDTIIVDLAKHYMFYFHFNITKKPFDLSLIYSETDSFLNEIRINDVYNDFTKNSHRRKDFFFQNFHSHILSATPKKPSDAKIQA